MPSIRVLIGDDHPVVRGGLRALLESLADYEVIGDADDGFSVVREAVSLRPDVVLMDLQMPGIDGVEATRRILVAAPEVKVLTLTMFDDEATVFRSMQAGARGYLLKGAGQAEIDRAIRAVVAGEAIFSPSVARWVLAAVASSGPATATAFPDLTPREREILDLVARGRRNLAISRTLGVSQKTVANHLSSIFAKLAVDGRPEAIVRAREHGLGTSDPPGLT